MKSHFPLMLDRPETSTVISGATYLCISFVFFPFMGIMFAQDESQMLYGAWIDIFYHLCNAVLAVCIFLRYLKDSFLNVQVYKKLFWATVGICTAAVVVLKIVIFGLSCLVGDEVFFQSAFGGLLTVEMELEVHSSFLVLEQPLWGTLVLVLACPFAISCLLYAGVFAPICTSRPWLAYVVVTAVLLLLRGVMIFNFWSSDLELMLFFISLPVHLLACLSYHITDTVWAPIAVHSFSNLVMALLVHLLVAPLL